MGIGNFMANCVTTGTWRAAWSIRSAVKKAEKAGKTDLMVRLANNGTFRVISQSEWAKPSLDKSGNRYPALSRIYNHLRMDSFDMTKDASFFKIRGDIRRLRADKLPEVPDTQSKGLRYSHRGQTNMVTLQWECNNPLGALRTCWIGRSFLKSSLLTGGFSSVFSLTHKYLNLDPLSYEGADFTTKLSATLSLAKNGLSFTTGDLGAYLPGGIILATSLTAVALLSGFWTQHEAHAGTLGATIRSLPSLISDAFDF